MAEDTGGHRVVACQRAVAARRVAAASLQANYNCRISALFLKSGINKLEDYR